MFLYIIADKVQNFPYCGFPISLKVCLLSLNVVNECCMKSLTPATCWKYTESSVLRATTTTTIRLLVYYYYNYYCYYYYYYYTV